MKSILKIFLILCIVGLTTVAHATFLLGVDNSSGSFEVFDTSTESVAYSTSVSETISGLTYAGGTTYYGVVNTDTGTDIYCYDLILNDNELTYTITSVTSLDQIGPVGGISYVDGSLLTIENDPHYFNNSNRNYGELYSIDIDSGSATSLERYKSQTEVEGLAYDGDSYLYYAETAYGNDTWIGAIDLTDNSDVYFGISAKLNGETITGLAYVDGSLYGVGDSGLYEFDTTTGSATLLTSSWGSDIDALTSFADISVPEPSSAIAFLILLSVPLWKRFRNTHGIN